MTTPTRTALLVLAAALAVGCQDFRHRLVSWFTPEYRAEDAPAAAGGGPAAAAAAPDGMQPSFLGPDAERPQLRLRMTGVVGGLPQITDLQFTPATDGPGTLLVAQKTGELSAVALPGGAPHRLAALDVLTNSEQGLLGLALAPDFATSGRFYLNRTVRNDADDADVNRVEAWRVDRPRALTGTAAHHEFTVLEVEQPYPNHNAGQLAFGPDDMLYVGWGDGGWRGDPHEHGQNPRTWLGSMLRLDVRRATAAQPYAVPADNPFADGGDGAPEVWAWGLRNPWRYDFGPDGRLIVADVGQNAWEEVDLVTRGANLGWNVREGRHCYPADATCATEGLVEPIYEYGHDEGQSITGGYVYEGRAIPALRGRYVFGDFVSGRLWAIALPPIDAPADTPAPSVTALGKWPMLPATFGQDAQGELYVADFGGGTVYRLDPAGAGGHRDD